MRIIAVILLVCFNLVLARQGFGDTEQDWGFVEVVPKGGIFWWLYYTTATQEPTERPLVIWLQGGPGASSTGFGNFEELGPVDENLNARNTTWIKDVNVLFVDNPIGTGYSFVDKLEDLATTNTQIAQQFLSLVKGFYKEKPEFTNVPLYIVCESYGGKMTAEIALVLQRAIDNKELKANFKGIGLGDSWISPIDSVLTWAPYLLGVGVIDNQGYEQIQAIAEKAQKAMEDQQFNEATNQFFAAESAIDSLSFGVDFYNILTKIPNYWSSKRNLRKPIAKDSPDEKVEALMNGPVREALNISRTWGEFSDYVFNYLAGDFMKPVTGIVEELLNTTSLKVFVYNGQLDLIVDTPGTVKWVDNLRFKDSEKWISAKRQGFVVDGIYEGYEKRLGNFGMFWVDRSGHMVPEDNPQAMRYILQQLTDNFAV